MKKLTMVLAICVISLSLIGSAYAQTATQTFNLAVNSIYRIGVSGNPGALTITDAVPGSNPTAVTDNSTTYAVTHNNAPAKITASLSTPLTPGYVLTLALAGGRAVDISTGSPDVKTGIAKGISAGNAILYSFSATAAAGILTTTAETVTLTLTN